MSELLQELVGQKVWVWTTAGMVGSAIIHGIGIKWMSLTSTPRGSLLLPLVNIQYIEVKDVAMAFQAAIGGLSPSLIGHRVTVSSITPDNYSRDTGLLEAFDDDWLRIRIKNRQLYFPVSSIVDLCFSP